jgi:hypothetical protein
MGTPMTYISGNTGAYQSGTFNKGTIALNLNPSSLASGNNWYNGVDVTATQYLIYSDTYSTGIATQANSKPTAWTTPDLSDTSLLNLINTLPDRVGLTPFTSLPLALQWLNATNEYFLIKTNFENIVTSGLVLNLDAGWYNSYSGTTTWFDIKGGYNGTLTNGPTFNGGSQGAIVFDGSDDYVVGPNIGSLSTFTVDCWFYPTSNPGNSAAIITDIYTSYLNYVIGWGNSEVGSNTFFGGFYNNGWVKTSGITATLNQWWNLTLTFSNGELKFYSFGNLYSTTSTVNTPQGGGSGYRVGRRWDIADYFFGKIPNVKIYNRALSPQEILQNYNAQKSRFGIYDVVQSGNTLNLSASNYLSYPRSGTTWFDMTSTGNNGTFVNGPTFNTGATPSIQFDGADDYINIPNGFTKTLKGKQYWTASIWVKVTSWGSGNDSFPVLVSIGANQGQYGELYLEIGNANQYYMAYAGDFAQGSFTTNLNQIYNLVYMKDGNSFKVYSNGVLIDTQTGKNNVSSVDGDLWIGRFKTGDYELNGNIYNFSMYDRALSASEIVQNFESQRNIYGATGYTTSGLILNLDAGNYASYPTTGTKWVDISGNYNNGNLINGPTWSSVTGGTFTFDGTDDYGSFSTNNLPSGNSEISFDCWVRWGGLFSTIYGEFVMGYGDDSGPNKVPVILINTSNQARFEFGSGSGAVISSSTISPNSWVNITATYNKSSTKIYLNGVLNGTTSYSSANITPNGSNGYNGGIGTLFSVYGNKNSPSRYGSFSGNISSVRIYNVGLSASEILQNYNALKGRFGL